MLDWVKEAIEVLPAGKKDIIKFNCLTGLRPSEAIESVRLLNKRVILPNSITTQSARHWSTFDFHRYSCGVQSPHMLVL
jgi:hypothetical protein